MPCNMCERYARAVVEPVTHLLFFIVGLPPTKRMPLIRAVLWT